MTKVAISLMVDAEIVKKLDGIVKSMSYLGISRSEVIETILDGFFIEDIAHERRRDAIIENRWDRLKDELYCEECRPNERCEEG